MDKTEVFIKMCEKAEEIQKLRKYEEGDIFYIWKGTSFEDNDELGGGQVKEDLPIMLKNMGGGRYYRYAMRSYGLEVGSYGLEVGSVFSEDPHGRIYKLEDVIWLPTQDQLQEIAFEHLKQKYPAYEQGKIVKYNYNTFDLLNSFTNFIADFEHIVVHNEEYSLLETTSNERLWLMLVMKKLYNKTWNGKEWIKKEE